MWHPDPHRAGAFARQPRITPDARQVHGTAFQAQNIFHLHEIEYYIAGEYNGRHSPKAL